MMSRVTSNERDCLECCRGHFPPLALGDDMVYIRVWRRRVFIGKYNRNFIYFSD